MPHRRTRFGLALGLVAIGVCACGERAFEPDWDPASPPPNLLFLSVDTLRADHLGFYGYERGTSPNLDRLAARSVVFDNAQAAASWTLPGLASVLTSFYSSTHNCWGFGSRLDPSYTTLTERLRDAGYDTACVTSHIFLATRYGLQQGFTHFDDAFAHPEHDPKDSITSERVSDEGVQFLRRKAEADDDTPWFLWLHYFDPHDTFMPHEGISERFVSAGARDEWTRMSDLYDGEIAFTDMHIGRVIDALEKHGFLDDTVIVFYSDHGEELGDHGAAFHGHTLFNELTRVPLFFYVPDARSGRVGGLVRTVDILPTVMELLSLPVPDDVEGFPLTGALNGGDVRELSAVAEIRLSDTTTMESIIGKSGRWKLVRHLMTDERELYDLHADAAEKTNVASENPEVVEELSALLKSYVERAVRKSEQFDRSAPLDLSPTQLERLDGLGYLGGPKR